MPKVIKKDKFSRPSVNDILLAGRQRSNDISNYNNYIPNDNTQVNNVIKKKYNTNRDKYLEPANKIGGYRALKTTAGKIGTALSTAPFAVAAIPALGTLGEVAAPTVAKVAGSLGGKLLGAGLTSAGLASGIDDVSKGEYHWYTPLDLAPGVGIGFKAAKNANKTVRNTKATINEIKKYINNPHIGNYYTKPEYNNLSYIRQVKDDAVNDMLKTGKMRSSHVATKNDELYDEANILLGKAEDADLSKLTFYNGTSKKPSKLPSLLVKQFEDQMFYTGRPFYGNKRKYNYIIKNPSEITDESKLTNKGLEWIESTHKKHSSDARASAIKQGIDPDKAPGRIVVPLYNGSKNEIPINEFGPFDLYRPVKVGNIELPFYKRTQFNIKNNRTSYAGGGKVPPAAAPVRLQINPTNLPLPFTNNEPVMPLMKGWELRSKLMKERSIAEYQDWLNKADPQIINAVRKMKNTKEPLTPYLKAWTPEQKETLRREYEIKKENNSDETPYYEYGVKNDLIPGATCINTSTAAHGEAHPSNVDFAENYKKYGYKRVDVNEMQPGDIIQLSTGGVPTHAMMATSTFDPIYKTFKTSQSHGGHAPSQMEHGKIFTIDPYQAQIRAAREDIKKGKKVDIKSLENDTRELPANIYHYLTPEGIMLYRKIPTTNNKNTYKFGGKITNKQDAIKSYKKPIPMDKIKYTPTIGVRIPSDSELRRQKEIESLSPNERYEYRRREAANEKRNNEFKALLNGFNNTFGRAASLASLIYGGGWAANRLIRGNKSSALGQHLSKYMIPANTIDTYGDATQFITNPSLSNGIELGAGIVGKKYRDYGKKSRQLFELGTQGLNAYNSYKFGGKVSDKHKITKPKQAPSYAELDEAILGEVMQQFRNIIHPANTRDIGDKGDPKGKNGGTAQRTYLLPRFEQEDIFLRDGYIKGKEGDYGLVKKAVNNRNLPIWQTAPDAVSRETLVPIGNGYSWDSNKYMKPDKDLVHAGSYPLAFYVDGSTGKVYAKGWDLNDYGGTGSGASNKYNILKKAGANILDFIGSPVVTTTGFQEVENPWGGPTDIYHLNRGATIQDLFTYNDIGDFIISDIGEKLDDTMAKQGLHRENIDGKWLYTLPEVTITGSKKAYNSYKFGGDVKSTPKRKHENNYIMKGTGNYVPKTSQEKVVVDLYNANYKSARRNMPREDALRQAHYRTTQQMMESGYGTSKQARKQNNYGGMGGSNSYNYKTINDFTDHVDTTMFKNFKNSYKAPTLKSYINGLYNGRIGAYSETPIEIYDKEFRGTHPRTSKIIEQLNPDDYTMLDNMYNPYGNTNMMYAKYGCKVRPKAWIGAAISAVAGIASSLINANAQKKAAARQARAEEAARNRQYATDLTTQLNNSSADDTQFYDQFKTEFKNGGKVKGYNPRITDGGVAIPIGHNTSLLRGSLHNEINESGNTGIGIKYGNNEVEAQDGEVLRKKKDKLLVYSDEDELGNGISPAKRVLKGENKDKVFAMQENNKRRKGIVNNNKTFLGGGHMTFTKGDAYGAAANAVGNIANFFINNHAINKMNAGKAPILVSPTKLNTVYNANAQLADINKSRLRMKNAVTRNTSSSVAALGRLNDIENSATDKINQIYENKNNVESQLMNQDRMNAQSVRLQNAAKIDEYERRVAEINNQKHLAKAQNLTSLINGLAGAAEQTINNAEERYYKDKNLELAAAPYDDETMSKFLEIEGAVPENRIVEIYLRNKDSQDPKKKALAELAFRRMNNFDKTSKYNSYINQEYRNKAKLIGNNGYKVPTLGNINTNIRLNGETPYYTNPLITRMLNRNNDFISYMNGYRY